MTDKDKFVNIADLKAKLRYWCKARGMTKAAQDSLMETIKRVTYTVRAELKNTLAPTIEPEVRHGRWIPYDADCRGYTNQWCCTNCKAYSYTSTYQKECEFEYCPNCGARMDADEIAERRAAADDYAEY